MAKKEINFIDDECGSNGYWDFAESVVTELIDKGIKIKDFDMAQETLYNILKYDLNDDFKRVAKLKVDKDGCIQEN